MHNLSKSMIKLSKKHFSKGRWVFGSVRAGPFLIKFSFLYILILIIKKVKTGLLITLSSISKVKSLIDIFFTLISKFVSNLLAKLSI